MLPLAVQAGAAAELITAVQAVRVSLCRAATDRPLQRRRLCGFGVRRWHGTVDTTTSSAVIRPRVGVQTVHFSLRGARDTCDDGAFVRRELQSALEGYVVHFGLHDALRTAVACTQQAGPRGTWECREGPDELE